MTISHKSIFRWSTRLLSLSNFSYSTLSGQDRTDDVNCTHRMREEESNRTTPHSALKTANTKTTAAGTDDSLLEINSTTNTSSQIDKHQNSSQAIYSGEKTAKNSVEVIRKTEKQRISIQNKQIIEKYTNLDQIQRKISQLSKQIKVIDSL